MHYPKILFVTLLFFAVAVSEATAQTPVTVRYDTLVVHDTVRVHDTLNLADYLRSEEFEQLFYSSEYVGNLSLTDSMKEKLLRQTVTYWENRVLQDEQQTILSMDSIKKYGLAGLIILGLNAMSPAQTDSTMAGKPHDPPQKQKPHLYESLMNGFHLGYTIQYDLIEPIVYQEYVNEEAGKITHSHPLHGFHAGVEFSYHFADYFGISAGLNFGSIGHYETIRLDFDNNIIRQPISKYGLSLPLKFEFHYPLCDNLLFTVSTGVRIRTPLSSFVGGLDGTEGKTQTQTYTFQDYLNIQHSSVYDRNVFNADILFDAGLYYRLPNEDFLSFAVGLNAATTDFMQGIESMEGILVIPPTGGYIKSSHRNNHLYFQIAYIQSFNKQRKIMQAQPHWSTYDGMKHRHEVRFEVGDPLGVYFLMNIYGEKNYGQTTEYTFEPNRGLFSSFRATPVFSLNYHYRLTKWLWAGAMVNYAYYKDHTDYGYDFYDSRNQHCITLMPELRFSYLNRPHVTIYSAVAAGATLFFGWEYHSKPYAVFYWEKSKKVYPTFQLTAFGIRAGGEHLFGTFELGAGIKGFASAGIGYAF